MLAILPKYLPVALGAILGLGTAAAQQQELDALLLRHASEVKRVRENETRLDSPEFSSIRTALDKAANQRDAYASGLYWFTDLEEAKKEAGSSGKPILSLRLLGRLDEEYSCANSRFFRTLLYADPEVSSHLRNNYVLHWKSQRPAPLLTIDMGDGRRVRRTVTGNSIHYVLDKDGVVVDALPGVYSPLAFLAALGRVEAFAIGKTAAERRIWHGK